LPVRIAASAVLILFAFAQTWWSRHIIFSDGISYLDIATNYARGDWHKALNEYWSPLLSWILAIIFRLFHPPPYWQVAMLHVINLAAFCVCLVCLELFVRELLRYRGRSEGRLSDQTIRIGAYASLFIAGLWHITTGYVSPDMVAMAILLLLAYLQLRIEMGRTGNLSYLLFGAALALGFLSRGAFASVLAVYLGATAVSLRRRYREFPKLILLVCAPILLLCGPFIVGLSAEKGHFTLGAAGLINYAWEVDGAPRSVHWEGEPPELGRPKHTTRKVYNRPATYEFASPVPGTYPPWYEPSYWYEGISPRFRWDKQLSILRQTTPLLVALFLASPIAIPCFGLILGGNWRLWLSRRGIAAYWFLCVPLIVYIALYVFVFMDKRYVGGALLILWTCLSASVTVSRARLRRFANVGFEVLCIVFVAVYAHIRLRPAVAVTMIDAVQGHESQWNLQWMIAERLRQAGVKRGDRIAFIGNAMDCEWARQLEARIVAEVPVIWKRKGTLSRGIWEDYKEVDAFWDAPPPVRARVLDAFRRAGASLVVVETLPGIAEGEGWQRVFPPGTPHLPYGGPQYDTMASSGYLKIGP
jgi:4-amino-4-deoxy-L-arabinose transferase-like glycosyltransferase